jgi:hypothetical protein
VGWHLRLWRRKKIGPGLGINLSKSGPSISIGPRGAKVTIGPRGVRRTVGLPGTGLFASEQQSWKALHAPGTRPAKRVVARVGSAEPGPTWLPVAAGPLGDSRGPGPAVEAGSGVPRTAAQGTALLAARPPAWEYLYFAALLLWGRDALEPKYGAEQAATAMPSGERFADDIAVDFLSRAIDELQAAVASLDSLFAPAALQKAFGPPGKPGDPGAIGQLAARWTLTYESLLDWAARIRGAGVSPRFRGLFNAAARLVDQPAAEYHAYVDTFVATMDGLPASLASGQPVSINLTLTLSLDEAALAAFTEALHHAGAS